MEINFKKNVQNGVKADAKNQFVHLELNYPPTDGKESAPVMREVYTTCAKQE